MADEFGLGERHEEAGLLALLTSCRPLAGLVLFSPVLVTPWHWVLGNHRETGPVYREGQGFTLA